MLWCRPLESSPQPLALKVRVAYALPAVALAVVGVPIFFYLPAFYTDVVGLDPTLFGIIFLTSRMFDGIADPIMGYLTDRTRSRWGRRRPYLVAGALPLALAVLMIYTPPHAGGSAVAVWLTIAIFALYAAWTMIIVPYEALGPELTSDFSERLSLLGLREAAYIVGTILAVGTPILIDAWLAGDGLSVAEHERQKFFWFGVVYAPTIIISLLVCAKVVRERVPAQGHGKLSIGAMRQIFQNRPFKILIVAFVVAALGNNLPVVLITYYLTYYLGSEHIHLILLTYFLLAVAFVPLWLSISRRIGKKQAWLWAMVVNTAFFLPVYFLPPGSETVYWVLVALSGTAGGAIVVIPPTMLADVIDFDELTFGTRREGQYVGVWFIARKLAAAVGAGVGLLALGLAGYEANQPQPPHVLTTLRILYVIVPVLCNVLSIALAMRFPIDRAEYERIRAGITARERAAGAA